MPTTRHFPRDDIYRERTGRSMDPWVDVIKVDGRLDNPEARERDGEDTGPGVLDGD